MDAATAELVRSSVAGQALKPGDIAPDFILPDAHGRTVRLYTELKRGRWCWFFTAADGVCIARSICAVFKEHSPETSRRPAHELLAISPQLPDESLTTREKDKPRVPRF